MILPAHAGCVLLGTKSMVKVEFSTDEVKPHCQGYLDCMKRRAEG